MAFFIFRNFFLFKKFFQLRITFSSYITYWYFGIFSFCFCFFYKIARDFIKKAKAEAENAKVSIRNVRREGNSQLKEFLKEKEISEDEERQGEDLIQKLTDSFVEKVDLALDAKEKDLLDF